MEAMQDDRRGKLLKLRTTLLAATTAADALNLKDAAISINAAFLSVDALIVAEGGVPVRPATPPDYEDER